MKNLPEVRKLPKIYKNVGKKFLRSYTKILSGQPLE